MKTELQAYDIQLSFANESPGRAQRRLMSVSGKPQLGEHAWLLGLAAYELLGSKDGRRASNSELSRYVNAAVGELDEALIALEQRHRDGTIALVRPGTGEPADMTGWRDEDWSWKVGMLGRLMLDLPGSSAVDVVGDYGADFLVAALFKLDDAAIAESCNDTESTANCVLEAAWFIERVQMATQIETAATTRLRTLDSRRASDRAKQRHATDPKRSARDFVYACWLAWRSNPSQYATATEFARAMLDKFPDTLTSEVVITRWVRAWIKGDIK